MQVHQAVGFGICFIAMIGIYYGNVWNAKSQPFMSTRLRTAAGKAYPVTKVFTGGVLNEAALEKYGIPHLTGSFAYAMLMANAAVSSSPSFLQLRRVMSLTPNARLALSSPTQPSSGARTSSPLSRIPARAAPTTDTTRT